MTPIKNMEYGVTVSRKGLKGSGLSVGQTVLITGTKPLPEKRSDPYLQRIYVVCIVVDEDGHHIPKEENEYNSYLIDPRCVERLPDDKQEEFREQLRTEYDKMG